MLGISYRIEPRLVRGLDYYTRTTFEFAGLALDAAQNAVGGGGRYDGLAEAIGGDPTPGIGFGIGIERLLLACDAEGCFAVAPSPADAFVVDHTGGEQARDLVEESQMKQADKSGARYAVIVGAEELSNGVVTLRPLRESGGEKTEQETVVRSEIVARLVELSEDGMTT